MPEGPFGGPRPLASDDIEIYVVMDSVEEFDITVETAEQRIRELMERDRFTNSKPDIVVDQTSTTQMDGRTVEFINAFVVKLRTDELGFVTLQKVLQLLSENFPMDEQESNIL